MEHALITDNSIKDLSENREFDKIRRVKKEN